MRFIYRTLRTEYPSLTRAAVGNGYDARQGVSLVVNDVAEETSKADDRDIE